MYILNHWPEYFESRNEGLGTTYERFILHRHFEILKDEFDVTGVLECPSFGMTGVSGINSMWWAAKGVPVTLMEHDRERLKLIEQVWSEVRLPVKIHQCDALYRHLPFQDRSFDLGWNFAALPFLSEARPVLTEMARVVRKAIVICVPNRNNPLVAVRIGRSRGRPGLFFENARLRELRKIMAELGWVERRLLSFDAPLWPDIAMSKEELLRRVGLTRIADGLAKRPGPPLCILDHFAGRSESMEKNVLRYGFPERLPEGLRRFWAHHQLALFIPSGGAGLDPV